MDKEKRRERAACFVVQTFDLKSLLDNVKSATEMNKNMICVQALVLLSIVCAIESQSIDKAALFTNPCTGKTNCGLCIQTSSCAWCMQPDFGDRPRCFQPDLKPATPCPEEFVVNPDNEQIMMREAMLSRGSAYLGDGSMVSGGSASGHGSSSGSMSGHGSASGGSSGHGSSSGSGSVVQISPQEVKLKLRISEFLYF
jgi:integrin beta 1